jgi:hypothetical protein
MIQKCGKPPILEVRLAFDLSHPTKPDVSAALWRSLVIRKRITTSAALHRRLDPSVTLIVDCYVKQPFISSSNS